MLKNIYLLLGMAFLAGGCFMPTMISTTVPTYPPRSFKKLPQNIVVANSYDVRTASVREKKEKLFMELLNLSVRQISEEITKRSDIPTVFVEGLSITSRSDDNVANFMKKNLASHAIFITTFDAFFEQTRVEVTVQNDGSKTREAFYDIIVNVGYSLHDGSGHQFDTLISTRRFHSSQSVLSGLLAVGPNIVTNADDAAQGIHANVDLYLKSFFKGWEDKGRRIYVTKEFKEMYNAIKVTNYQRAFDLSMKLIDSNNQKVSGMANYNCAVLLERKGDYEKVKPFLQESLRKYNLPFARIMMLDYRHY